MQLTHRQDLGIADLLDTIRARMRYYPELGELRHRGRTGVKDGKRVGCPASGGRRWCALLGKRYQVASLVWLLEHRRIPGRLTRLNGDQTDDRITNLAEWQPKPVPVKPPKPPKAPPKKYVQSAATKERRRVYGKQNAARYAAHAKRHYHANKHRPDKKAAALCRNMLNRVLAQAKAVKTAARTHEANGYTASELRAHLELQFEPWMSWANHGQGWHVDHILPVAWFIEQGVTDPHVINALHNLRPLASSENLRRPRIL